jgi:MFS family permease
MDRLCHEATRRGTAAAWRTAADASAVNAVLPVIRRALNASVAGAQWIVLAGLLATSGLLLAFGHWGDRRGHRHVYLCGLITFAFGCALCATAPSLAYLVACRMVAGAGIRACARGYGPLKSPDAPAEAPANRRPCPQKTAPNCPTLTPEIDGDRN